MSQETVNIENTITFEPQSFGVVLTENHTGDQGIVCRLSEAQNTFYIQFPIPFKLHGFEELDVKIFIENIFTTAHAASITVSKITIDISDILLLKFIFIHILKILYENSDYPGIRNIDIFLTDRSNLAIQDESTLYIKFQKGLNEFYKDGALLKYIKVV